MGNSRFKFRVWKKAENKMVKGVTYLNPLLLDEEIAPDEAKNYVIMQCTSLKDKNGKLIYEGDIVSACHTTPMGTEINMVCIVEFDRGAFWINFRHGATYLVNDDTYYEIIGNIYENKELLNESISNS